jgi:hypothetical protein
MRAIQCSRELTIAQNHTSDTSLGRKKSHSHLESLLARVVGLPGHKKGRRDGDTSLIRRNRSQQRRAAQIRLSGVRHFPGDLRYSGQARLHAAPEAPSRKALAARSLLFCASRFPPGSKRQVIVSDGTIGAMFPFARRAFARQLERNTTLRRGHECAGNSPLSRPSSLVSSAYERRRRNPITPNERRRCIL